jgi:DegV family protein with EDD domain
MKPKKTMILTDSTCDIPVELRARYNILVVPLFILFGEEMLRDGIDIKPEVFYERLQSDSVHPTTSQPSPQDFLNLFETARRDGVEEIVAILISGAMSGTIESARQASKMIDLPIHIHDSRSNSMGLGWQVIAAARALEAGGNVKEILATAEKVRVNVHYIVSLDTLKYLSTGGRIGDAAGYLGGLLNIKPQIYVNHETGRVGAGVPSRTRKKAINTLFDRFFKAVQPQAGKPLRITVLHNAAREEAEQLTERIKAAHSPTEIMISIVSPVLGVHTGPKAIALCGYVDEE